MLLVTTTRELRRRKYLVGQDLGIIPRTAEENVTVVIHIVSSGNEAVYLQWPPDSPLFVLHDLYGEDLRNCMAKHLLGSFHMYIVWESQTLQPNKVKDATS